MSSPESEFDVLPGAEMKAKYYGPDEVPPVLKLNPDKVPEALRAFIPLAERWGIGDDILREEAIERATDAERAELQRMIDAHRGQFNDWLAGLEADADEQSAEYQAFTLLKMVADGY